MHQALGYTGHLGHLPECIIKYVVISRHNIPKYTSAKSDNKNLVGFINTSTLLLHNKLEFSLIMAALWNRAGHYILPCDFYLLLLLFFPCLISVVGDWMSTILSTHGVCGLSANLECMSEMCCTQLAESTGCKKSLF